MATETAVPRSQAPGSHEPRVTPLSRWRERKSRRDATREILTKIEHARTWLPAWRREMDELRRAAVKSDEGAFERELQEAGDLYEARHPGQIVAELKGDKLPAETLVGSHVEHLRIALQEAEDRWRWTEHEEPGDAAQRAADVAHRAASASAALQRAMQHALFFMYLDQVRSARVGQRIEFDDALVGWGLTKRQVDEVWSWIQHDTDMTRFNRKCLPILVDRQTRSAYRTPSTWPQWIGTTTAAVWGAALALAAIIVVFALLDRAGMTEPPVDWFVKLVVLYLFVLGGAVLHIASMSLGNIRFGDPLQVYVASSGATWLALRWVAILRLYIPIAVVAGSLWGAGNIPESFEQLGTAILAGYSADSLFRASLSRLQAQGSAQTDASAVTQAEPSQK
jgi:hypothetical protein